MNIPDKALNRLTLYHVILSDQNSDYISSATIADLLHIDDSQVRKDIAYLGNSGKCRVGYDVKRLKKSIEESLGFKQVKNAFIIGAGNLGSALAKYDNFSDYGLNIIAMFDNDLNKIGTQISNKNVFSISEIETHIKKSNVEIAILTVPRNFAQRVAEVLIKSGIKYIWNFTPCVLDVPKEIIVWNENLVGSFLQFTNNDEVKSKNDN